MRELLDYYRERDRVLSARVEAIVQQIAELTTPDAAMCMPAKERANELAACQAELEEIKRGLSSISR